MASSRRRSLRPNGRRFGGNTARSTAAAEPCDLSKQVEPGEPKRRQYSARNRHLARVSYDSASWGRVRKVEDLGQWSVISPRPNLAPFSRRTFEWNCRAGGLASRWRSARTVEDLGQLTMWPWCFGWHPPMARFTGKVDDLGNRFSGMDDQLQPFVFKYISEILPA